MLALCILDDLSKWEEDRKFLKILNTHIHAV